MFNKKRLAISVLLMFFLLLTGCLGVTDNSTQKGDINVTIVDKFDQQASAKVNLLDENGELVDIEEGSTVIFNEMKYGEYTVEATISGKVEKPGETVIVNKNEVSVKLKFDTFSSSSSVQEKIFNDEDTKNITIKNLREGEKAIIGVSPFVFAPEDASTYTAAVRVTKSATEDSNELVSPLNVKNPEYIYNPAPKVDLPKIKSLDPKLRKIEKQLFEQKTKEQVPTFEANNYSVGQEVPLWVGDYGAMEQITTVVEGVGDKSAILVEKDIDFLTDAELDNYVDQYIAEFDNHIYPTNTSFYSNKFDIDQNGKLTIVFIDMGGVENGAITMGYFWGKDFYSQKELDEWGYEGLLYSNEQDIVYINIRALKEGWEVTDHFSTIGHEFQHLLWFYNCWEKDAWYDDSWINEGMSTYSEQVNGYQVVDSRIYCYFDNGYIQLKDSSQVSLLHWTQTLADYGISNLFTNYIAEQYGEGILHAIYANIDTDTSPRKVIMDYTGLEFEDIFMDFMIANKLHSLNLAPEYSYDLPLEGDPTHTPINPDYSGFTPELRPSGVKYFEVTGTGTDVTLEIVGTIADEKVGAFVYRY